MAPDCAGAFTESTSLWSAKTDSLGKLFHIPKSCKPCRDLRRRSSRSQAIDQPGLQLPTADANLTLAIEDFDAIDVDPDDDYAMADYAF